MTTTAPLLKGKKLYLRPLAETDVTDAYVGWLNDPEVNRYLEVGRMRVTKQDVRDRLKTYGEGTPNRIFAIVDKASERHIGNVTLNNISAVHGHADTGLIIGEKDFWGQGCAREAWSLAVDYAFTQLDLRKVEAGVVVGNTGSEKALRALGFVEEGRQREHFFAAGAHRDVVRLGLFPKEFTPCH